MPALTEAFLVGTSRHRRRAAFMLKSSEGKSLALLRLTFSVRVTYIINNNSINIVLILIIDIINIQYTVLYN